MSHCVVIYQMKDVPGKFVGTMFGLHDMCVLKNGQVPQDVYNKVYEYEQEGDVDLEEVFYQFNNEYPADFRGHSLSVSDIVEVDGKLYFCDSAGFKECEWR